MIELELTRSPNDRRLYVLEHAGTLRLEGLLSRKATAEAGRQSWHFARSGFWQRVIQAMDARTVVGEFSPRDLRRGGRLHWAGRELTLRPASSWRERYALAEGERELVLIDGKSWGRRPVKRPLRTPARSNRDYCSSRRTSSDNSPSTPTVRRPQPQPPPCPGATPADARIEDPRPGLVRAARVGRARNETVEGGLRCAELQLAAATECARTHRSRRSFRSKTEPALLPAFAKAVAGETGDNSRHRSGAAERSRRRRYRAEEATCVGHRSTPTP
jgi:hypothetical protein